jgi:long-chain acyl-CoA synthetase
MNIVDLFEENIKKLGTFDSLIFNEKSYTNIELLRSWRKIGGILKDLGVMPNDRVVVLLPVCPEAHMAIPAVWMVGATLVPIHFTYSSHEVEAIFKTVRPRAIITTLARAVEIEKLLPAIFDRSGIIVVDINTTTKFSNINQASELLTKSVSRNDKDPAVIIFSSGSSGRPKGVIQTHAGIISLVESFKLTRHGQASSLQPFFSEKRTVTIDFSSYAHTGRLFFLVTGYCRYQTTILIEKFDSLQVLEKIQKYQVTYFGGSPVVYQELCNHPDFPRYNISSVRAWCFFAAPMAEEKLVQYERALGQRVCAMYGMSESVQAVTVEPGDTARRPGTVGLPVYGVSLKIIDDNGDEVAQGAVGELCVSREANALGYLDSPEETAKVFRGKWIHTGDQVRQDKDGYIYIIGRNSSMINQGGVKIIPGEVEAVISKMPGVDGCVVAGIPDDLFGQIVGAFVVPEKNTKISEAEVSQYCRQFLSENKIPRKIYFVQEFPKNRNMKIDISSLILESTKLDAISVRSSRPIDSNLSCAELRLIVEGVARQVLAEILKVPADIIESGGILKDIGMSSLKAVEFSVLLARKLGHPIRSDLAFSHPTLEKIAVQVTNTIVQFNKESVKKVGLTPAELLPELQKLNGDKSYLKLKQSGKKRIGTSSQVILMTGATGYFGTNLIDNLVRSSDKKIICLVRGRNDDEAASRLRTQLAIGGFDEKVIMPRLRLIAADLTKERFGLSQKIYDDLAEKVDAIYHIAALVNHLFAVGDLWQDNVIATESMIKFAAIGKSKSLCYVSTIAVGVTRESGSLDHDRPLRTGYAQSKWVVEKMIESERENGLIATIFRPGQMCWSSENGMANESQVECLMLKSIIGLGEYPPISVLSQILPNLTPIDFAARAMIYLFDQSASINKTFHLISPLATDWAGIVAGLRRFEPKLIEVSYEQWLHDLENRVNEFKDGAATKMLGLLRNDRAMGGFDYTCNDTTEALRNSNIPFTSPADTVEKCLEQLTKSGFLRF